MCRIFKHPLSFWRLLYPGRYFLKRVVIFKHLFREVPMLVSRKRDVHVMSWTRRMVPRMNRTFLHSMLQLIAYFGDRIFANETDCPDSAFFFTCFTLHMTDMLHGCGIDLKDGVVISTLRCVSDSIVFLWWFCIQVWTLPKCSGSCYQTALGCRPSMGCLILAGF